MRFAVVALLAGSRRGRSGACRRARAVRARLREERVRRPWPGVAGARDCRRPRVVRRPRRTATNAGDREARGSWPVKVLVVVDPNAAPTVTIAARSRGHASLGYNDVRHNGRGVPLDRGTQSVRFEACRAERGPRVVEPRHAVRGLLPASPAAGASTSTFTTEGRIIRRALRFGVPRCARLTTPDA